MDTNVENPKMRPDGKSYSVNSQYFEYTKHLNELLQNEENLIKILEEIWNLLDLLEESSKAKILSFDQEMPGLVLDVLSTYEVKKDETPLTIKRLIDNDISDLEHFNIFDYSDQDYNL